MNLTDLANKFGSDKGTTRGEPPHRYTYLYDLIFSPLRDKPINFLEMGLAVGGPEVGGPVDRQVMSPSVAMWTDYFSSATIYGFDISDFSHIDHPRFRFIRGDSGSPADITRLADSCSSFNVIIDDASHASYHQQLALKHLWPKVADNGLYVIEDLQWQSPVFEDSLPAVPKTADLLISWLNGHSSALPSAVLDAAFLDRLKEEAYSFSAFPALDGTSGPIKQIVLRKVGAAVPRSPFSD